MFYSKVSYNVLFLEWLNPPYVGGHWTPQLIRIAGGHHPLNPCQSSDMTHWSHISPAMASTAKDPSEILNQKFDFIFICPCGLDLQMTKKELKRLYQNDPQSWWFQLLKKVPTWLVDGNQYFNRPGPRLLDALEILSCVFNNTSIPQSFAAEKLDWETLDPFPLSKPTIDIEELHKRACIQKKDFYEDPETGYRVLTSHFLRARGRCCGNGCRHCPYGHMNVKNPLMKKNRIEEMILVNYQEIQTDKVQVLFFSGGKDSWLTYLHLKKESKFPIVLLTTFGFDTQSVSIQDIPILKVIEQAKHMDVGVMCIPLKSNQDYKTTVLRAFNLLEHNTNAKIERIVFGDLHLQDIRQWRVDTFSSYNVHTPLFNISYDELLNQLWKSVKDYNLRITISSSDMYTVGTLYNQDFINTLKSKDIDVMGENGEFHTFVEFL